MNRTDRLYALREELRRAGPLGRSGEQLATTFEVSPRTIKRDVSALQQSGFPVWARLGRTGGYVVDPSATLPPVNFTPAEAAALATALEAHRGQPFDGEGRAALAKVLTVMDESTRRETGRLAGRIWIDGGGAGEGAAPVRGVVQEGLLRRRILTLRYRDGGDAVTVRDVDPQLFARTGGHWFLVARCRLRDGIRWFRLDRIEQAGLTSRPAIDVPLSAIGEPPKTARAASV